MSDANLEEQVENISLNEDDDSDAEREYQHPRAKMINEDDDENNSAPVKKIMGGDEEKAGLGFGAVQPWASTLVEPTNAAPNNPSPPNYKLSLEYAYGYRAFDSRNNIAVDSNGRIVYPTAGIVVVYDLNTQKQSFFMGHDDDIRCLTQHPIDRSLFASGQNATVVQGKSSVPYICIWNSNVLSSCKILKLTPSERTVRSVGFSYDGRYLASISNDNNHTIRIWDWKNEKCLDQMKGDTNPIFQIKWNHINTNEFVTVGKKHLEFHTWNEKINKFETKKGLFGKIPIQTLFSVTFTEKGFPIVSAYDGTLILFSNGKALRTIEGHKGKAYAVERYAGGIVSGSGDKTIRVYNSKSELLNTLTFSNKINTLCVNDKDLIVGTTASEIYMIRDFVNNKSLENEWINIVRGHFDGELWGLAADAFGLYTAGEDNTIRVWDFEQHKQTKCGIINTKKGAAPKIKKASTTSTFPTNQCARAIAISPDGSRIIIGLNNGEVNIYDDSLKYIQTIDLNKYGKRQVTDQTGNWIQAISFSPSGQTVAIGTHGSVIVLLETKTFTVKAAIEGHHSFITHIDWSADSTTIQSTCGAYELLYHNVDENTYTVKQITTMDNVKNIDWYTQTCTFGWSVQGIYSGSQSGDDVNAVDVNRMKTLAVTGDDFGKVNLYRFPVASKSNQKIAFKGHSSHVANVKFSTDGTRVFSVGGHDLTVLQWQVVETA